MTIPDAASGNLLSFFGDIEKIRVALENQLQLEGARNIIEMNIATSLEGISLGIGNSANSLDIIAKAIEKLVPTIVALKINQGIPEVRK